MDRVDHVWARRRADVLVATMTLVSSGAMLGLSQRADERFNPYRLGGPWFAEPSHVVGYAIAYTRATARQFGNVRPFGRMVEHANYWISELLGRTTGLPSYVTFGLLRVLSAVALGLALVRLTQRITTTGSWAPLVVAGAFPSLLVVYGNTSSMVVFSGMYMQTTLLVIACAWLVATPGWFVPGRPTWWRLGAMALLGFFVAWFNELAWVAVPAAGATLVGLLLARGTPVREWPAVAAVRMTLAAGAGFLATAVPTRVIIQRACDASGASCYVASDPDLAGMSIALLLARMFAGLPFKAWGAVGRVASRPEALPVALLIGLGLLVLLWPRVRSEAAPAAGPTAGPVEDGLAGRSDGRQLLALALVGSALLVSGAAISSLSPSIQGSSNVYLGWREAPVAFGGWALVLAAMGAWLLEQLTLPARGPVLAVVTTLGVTAAVMATGLQHDRDSRDPRLLLADRIAVEVASFDVSPGADARRCALLDEFAALHAETPSQTERMIGAAADIARARYHQPFCSEAPSP